MQELPGTFSRVLHGDDRKLHSVPSPEEHEHPFMQPGQEGPGLQSQALHSQLGQQALL